MLSLNQELLSRIKVRNQFKGEGGHSVLGCCDTFFKIVSLLKSYRSEGYNGIHFLNALCTGFSKYQHHYYIGATNKRL